MDAGRAEGEDLAESVSNLSLYKQQKKKGDPRERRHARQEEGVQLRKAKRNEMALKRRNLAGNFSHLELSDDVSPELLEELKSLVGMVLHGDIEAQFKATTKFRRLLSKEANPPIQQVIDCGVVPNFVTFLQYEAKPELQFEAAWALTNIASGAQEQTKTVIDAGAVPIFVRLLESPNEDVREQAVWALGNIAGDGPRCRDLVLGYGILQPLLRLLEDNSSKPSMLRNGTWTLSNLCRGKNPPPDFALVSQGLGVLSRLTYHRDTEVLTDACWALSYLTDGPNENIQKVIDAGVCRHLVELLFHETNTIVTPALRAIGNIVTGDDLETQVVLNCNVVAPLRHLLNHPRESIKKETCWTISNITAGNVAQIQAVLDGELIPGVLQCLAHAEFKTRKEACWAISNATLGGTPAQIHFLVESGCIEPLCNVLSVTDHKVIEVALDGIENILRVGDQSRNEDNENPYALMVEECKGLDKIEFIQSNPNQTLYQKAYSIVRNFFQADELEQDALALQPEVNASGHYQFGTGMGGMNPGGFQM